MPPTKAKRATGFRSKPPPRASPPVVPTTLWQDILRTYQHQRARLTRLAPAGAPGKKDRRALEVRTLWAQLRKDGRKGAPWFCAGCEIDLWENPATRYARLTGQHWVERRLFEVHCDCGRVTYVRPETLRAVVGGSWLRRMRTGVTQGLEAQALRVWPVLIAIRLVTVVAHRDWLGALGWVGAFLIVDGLRLIWTGPRRGRLLALLVWIVTLLGLLGVVTLYNLR